MYGPILSIINSVTLSKDNRFVGNNYDKQEIRKYLRKDNLIEFDLGYQLYLVLNDTSYLETSYNQVQEKADNLEPDVKTKFLTYPIPSAIVEEWEKVK